MTTITAPLHQSVIPNTPRTRLSKSARPPPCHHARYVLDDKPSRAAAVNENMECTNCGTKNTSAWRRSADGKSECNACNLFFRKNGRKRPASMRRDTIARRYRLSRCDLCAMETQSGPTNFTQFQKAVSRHRRNGKTPLKVEITQNDAIQSSEPVKSQSNTTQNFFVPHNSFTQPLPTFVPSNIEYNHQNSMVMSYTTERPLFNIVNGEQQPDPSKVEEEICFSRHSQNTIGGLPEDVFGRHILATASNASLNVVKQDAVDEEFDVTDQDSQNHSKETYQNFTEYPVEQSLVKNEMINNEQFENQYNEPYAIIKEENSSDSFLDCSSAVHKPLLDVEPASATASRSTLTGTFDIFKEENHEERDESMLVFRSL
ncbi:GATA zinc finger [Dictyocaulus viviparus]|uniref:GATA zinc finger n=1 Tax=Dictyocaulus viviparus TaxID=29172 RepID=A0A0D8XLM1_DICVI|nr:GATA zinc finger [Dictyocaulus viviparus]